jgi:hypothetical protein
MDIGSLNRIMNDLEYILVPEHSAVVVLVEVANFITILFINMEDISSLVSVILITLKL